MTGHPTPTGTHVVMRRGIAAHTAMLAATLLALTAISCSKPKPLPVNQPPEPQANTELREAIQQPIDKAKAADQAIQDAAAAQKAALEASGG